MSLFENYNKKATYYNQLRVPVGLEYLPTDLKGKIALECGSGTGNYIEHFLNNGIEKMYSFEGSSKMISVQRERYKDPRLVITQGNLLEKLPYDDNSFDYISINQVIHHLDTDQEFNNITTLMGEFYRILKPGGELFINHCSHQQLKRGHWYYKLIPDAVEKIVDKYIPISYLIEIGSKYNLEINGLYKVKDPIQGNYYFNPDIVLDKDMRNCDSTWSLVSDGDLDDAMQTLIKHIKEDTIGEYIETNDKDRKLIGQTSHLCFVKL
jgi:ubiquinone/menaquinone biosynthesis C-methylase UbiE